MSAPRIGGLCFGYGGLDLSVQQVIPDAELAWYAEFDKGASKIGAHRFPGIPNHGDMTKIDWSAVEPVDIITGGTPCQDLSHAGKRNGMTEGTRSNLWVAMREAIAQIRPSLVVWENVRGAYSAEATSDLESDPRLLASVRRRDGEPVLRALARVLGDLSDLGYDAIWHGLRAADVGAPHGRFRVFVVAYPQGHPWRLEHGDGSAARDASESAWGGPQQQHLCAAPGSATEPRREPVGATASLLPTPRTSDTNGAGHVEAARLLPTPTTMDAAGSRNSTAWRSNGGEGVNIGDTLTDFAWKHDGHHDPRMPATEPLIEWGQYSAAIHRWESLTRPAPAPTEPGPKGNPRLSAAFSEWMMGLPAGWVADVPGITRNEALKALGNGVVPQQAAAALRLMLTAARAAA